jgi:CopG family transcriptional regulator/antitoxin EndoAI
VHRRLNISLPEETVKLLDRVAAKGDRSRVIAEAVTRYVTEVGKASLRKAMEQRAVTRADLDLQIAGEWLALDREAWPSREK